ncbi:hypothetical protein BT63DRAFT_121722 [Microthyrium microscopicum]|uniref:Uncharacterized protein n=1 Tax=Microthyrium microscopicum TaxID=703497 RepID=A0A6A6TW32_9PEZI|nr:hypothetical protein BT63DRAFT_121722 [Microthyrium microscopicum]
MSAEKCQASQQQIRSHLHILMLFPATKPHSPNIVAENRDGSLSDLSFGRFVGVDKLLASPYIRPAIRLLQIASIRAAYQCASILHNNNAFSSCHQHRNIRVICHHGLLSSAIFTTYTDRRTFLHYYPAFAVATYFCSWQAAQLTASRSFSHYS